MGKLTESRFRLLAFLVLDKELDCRAGGEGSGGGGMSDCAAEDRAAEAMVSLSIENDVSISSTFIWIGCVLIHPKY